MARVANFITDVDRLCFEHMFDIENFLRTLIRWEMRGNKPREWKGLFDPEMLKEAEARLNTERDIAILDARESSILAYLTLSELRNVLLDNYVSFRGETWPPQGILDSEFRKLIAVRNKIAHFRPATERDLRIVERFSEDLVDWSKNYRSIRKRGFRIDSREGVGSLGEKNSTMFMVEFWNEVIRLCGERFSNATLGILQHHFFLAIHLDNQSIEPENFETFINKNERWITFCRIGDLGEKASIYVPRELGEGKLLDIFLKFIELFDVLRDSFSSDEARALYQVPKHECLLNWAVQLPSDFRV